MAIVERLLRASTVRVELEDVRTRDAQWCLARYFDELGAHLEAGFDPARSISASTEELSVPRGYFVVARL
jgi:hypothetical protein